MSKFFERFNRILTRVEKTGFKVANKAHIYAVNGLLLFCAYNVYTVLHDYNATFKEERV